MLGEEEGIYEKWKGKRGGKESHYFPKAKLGKKTITLMPRLF
jgi:hypothetical protein